MIPDKLKTADEIRIIAPSRSLGIVTKELKDSAVKMLEKLGFHVTFGKHAEEVDLFKSSSIESRISDLHAAFADRNVKMVLTVIGGYNANQLLKYIDYGLIKANPKILCGFSDITVLSNAIYAKTGLVTYSGPHFTYFGMQQGFDYIYGYFSKCLQWEAPFEVIPSEYWSDDAWYRDQDNRQFVKNEGPLVMNEGEAEGIVIGGNLCTFNLLHGTEYLPDLTETILFLEEDDLAQGCSPEEFDRNLQSVLHQRGFEGVKGMVLGRFQKGSKMSREKLLQIIKTKKELDRLPVIANVDFGHTNQTITFPIGGRASIKAVGRDAKIVIHTH